MSDGRLPLTIALKPWFCDHHFGGRTILPAVETMLVLAAMVAKIHPEVDLRVMEEVRFPRFLEVPPEAATLAALGECSTGGTGQLRCKLLSRVQLKAMRRIKEHGEIIFPPAGDRVLAENPRLEPVSPTEQVTTIGVDRLYRELVPFGPTYRTLQDTLYLAGRNAWGRVKAPALPAESIQEILGSPFPLDGALHAACALGQQSVDFVPFPVGFARRVIHRPTQPGGCYQIRVQQVSGTTEELVFDLEIFDDENRLYESVTAVRMRDVSGAIKR